MKTVLRRNLMLIFVTVMILAVKVDAKADSYRYWDGKQWRTPSSNAYTSNPVDITYDVTYCYEEAYKMIDLVNAERRKAGVPELQAKDEIMDAAMLRAAETAIYWEHIRPDGSSYCSASIYSDGENCHAGSAYAADANKSLVNSSGHYAQMIDSMYSYAGYGCVKVDNTYYWVQVFSIANIYYEDGYDRLHPENNRPVQWEQMTVGNRKDYTAKFTAKVNPKLIALTSTYETEQGEKEVYVGEEVQGKVYTHYTNKRKGWDCEIKLTAEQYDIKVLTPELCSFDNGRIKALKAGTAKIQYTLKADSSLTTVLELEIKEAPVKRGSRVAVGENEYKVTGNKTVSFYRSSKDAVTVSVPKTVKIQNKTYKVTAVASGAFKDNSKLRKVVIGENVTTIGSKAFNGCKSLKKITVKTTKLKSVGKNALKGIHKKAVVKVPGNKLAKYKKLFNGKGQKKTVTIKK